MRAATEGNLPPFMPQGNLVEDLGREVRPGLTGELMVESSPSCQRRPPCKTNKGMSDEAADTAALTYSLTYLLSLRSWLLSHEPWVLPWLPGAPIGMTSALLIFVFLRGP